MLISKWPPGSHIGIFSFRTLTLVWLWISAANLSGTILIYIGTVGAYWFSATSLSKWLPGGHIGFFGFRTNFTLALNIQLQTSVAKYFCIWVRAYCFSVTSFSKWLPGGHIRFFGFWMAWFRDFRQRNSSLLWNFSFKFHVHVLCGCRQKPNDCQLCRFQNGCLVILNNVQLQSTHCPLPPSPMGRGYPSRSLIYNF